MPNEERREGKKQKESIKEMDGNGKRDQ